MTVINKKTYENSGAGVIVDDNVILRLNGKHIEIGLDQGNLPAATKIYGSDYGKRSYELVDNDDYQPCRVFLRKDLALKVIMNCRTEEVPNFRKRLGFNSHAKEETVLGAVKLYLEEKI